MLFLSWQSPVDQREQEKACTSGRLDTSAPLLRSVQSLGQLHNSVLCDCVLYPAFVTHHSIWLTSHLGLRQRVLQAGWQNLAD